MDQTEEIVEKSSTSKCKEGQGRLSNQTKRQKSDVKLKRCGKQTSNDLIKTNPIPIFTDAFLDLFRQQKSEIRSLKLTYSQLSERFKLKDAQQEQIRLDNQKMRLDIEEISQKNSFFQTQLEQIEQQFQDKFHQTTISEQFLLSLHQSQHQQDYQNKLFNICQFLQF